MTTIYFVGGEDTSFTLLNGATFSTSLGQFRSAYSRGSMYTGNGSSTTPTGSNQEAAQTPQFGPVSSFWIHGQYGQFNSSIGGNSTLISALDASGIPRILIRPTGSSGQVKISTINAAGTIVDLVTSAVTTYIPTNTTMAIDLFINYAVSGQVTLYVNGVNICDTGAGVNVTTNSVTQLAQVQYIGTYPGVGGAYWSECIIQDTSTLGTALWTLIPAAAGNTQSWTPNTVANINKANINDTTYVSTTSINQLSEWTTNTTVPAGTWSVEALVTEARISAGNAAPQTFEWLVRTKDGSDHVAGSVTPLSNFSNFSSGSTWVLNPHTSAAWVTSDFAAGFNIGIESTT